MIQIYVASAGETLRSIAEKRHIDVCRFLESNPGLTEPDADIGGCSVHIPVVPAAPAAPDIPESVPILEVAAKLGIRECPPGDPGPRWDDWIPHIPAEEMAQNEYDVLIVGSGAGGGAVLWRLCEQWGKSGKRVGMVEGGGLLLPTHYWNIPTIGNVNNGRYLMNPKIARPVGPSMHELSGALEVIGLGGKTLFWGTVSPRVLPSIIQSQWPITPEEMLPYYDLSEDVMNISEGFNKESSIQSVLLERLRFAGFPEVTNAPMAVDMMSTRLGKIHSSPAFSSILFLARALNAGAFDLAIHARAVQVLTEDAKAVGVRVMTPDMKSHTIRAKTVVLSANAFQTPRLLLNSGIPGRAIGHYLSHHSFLSTTIPLDTAAFPESLGALAVLIPQSEKRPYQIQMHGPGGANGWYNWYQQFEIKPSRAEWNISLISFGQVDSRYENQVYLVPSVKDEYGVPVLGARMSYTPRDMEVIRQMAAGLRRAAFVSQARPAATAAEPDICRVRPGADYHAYGTCRMGNDPLTSSTNRYGQIHGINGLFVADNSVLPPIGAANPTLTTIALAIRTADYIRSSLQ